MNYISFKETFLSLQQLGQVPDLPIARIVAVNIKKMKPIIESVEDELDTVIDKYAVLTEDGSRRGKIKDQEGNRIDISEGYRYADIDVDNEEEYTKAVESILKREVEYDFVTIPSNKMISRRIPREYEEDGKKVVRTVEVDRELLDVLEEKVSANVIVKLLDTIIDFVE